MAKIWGEYFSPIREDWDKIRRDNFIPIYKRLGENKRNKFIPIRGDWDKNFLQ